MDTVTYTDSCDFYPRLVCMRKTVQDGFLWDNKPGVSKSHRGSNDNPQRSAAHTSGRTNPQHEGSRLASPHPRCTDTQHLSHSRDTHLGRQEQYREMVKRVRIPTYPNQLYRVPLTDNQRYGWSVTKTGGPEPWTQMKRYPRQNSEMTNFVKAMMLTDPDFSLF